MQLRDYQLNAIAELRRHLSDRPLCCLPTGAGKTSVASEIIRRVVNNGRRAVFLVHRRELVDQAVERLEQFGVKAGRILAGYPERRTRPVQVASIPTLLKRDHWPADLVIVDECAHAVSASWQRCLERYDGSWIIGLTATPIRLDGRGLGDLFGCIVEPVTTRQLIAQGYLVEPTVYAPPLDLSGVRVRRGDYDLPQITERMSKLTGSITETWMRHARGLRTVVFAVNVDHSERIVQAFRDLGVRAEHIDGGTATRQRARTLRKLRSGRLDLVSNCMVLSEGWDLPALRCAILARPTKSLALFRQMVGRVMRPPGPVVVLDHAGNHHEHGPVTDEIEWSLDTPERRAPTGGAVRTCLECYAIALPGATACPECGAPLSVRDEATPPEVHAPGELVAFKPTREDRLATYRDLVIAASVNERRLGWARNQYRTRFGVWPRGVRDIETELYRCPTRGLHQWEVKEYGARRVKRCEWCYVEWAAVKAG